MEEEEGEEVVDRAAEGSSKKKDKKGKKGRKELRKCTIF